MVHQKVLARTDKTKPYGPQNCYWRKPKNSFEEKHGIEYIGQEPDIIPLTPEQSKERNRLPKKERRLWDIWHRMKWRCEHN